MDQLVRPDTSIRSVSVSETINRLWAAALWPQVHTAGKKYDDNINVNLSFWHITLSYSIHFTVLHVVRCVRRKECYFLDKSTKIVTHIGMGTLLNMFMCYKKKSSWNTCLTTLWRAFTMKWRIWETVLTMSGNEYNKHCPDDEVCTICSGMNW